MAHSTWTIPNTSVKTKSTINSKSASPSRTRAQGNFATLMAQEQTGSAKNAVIQASASAKSHPQVARLPETGGLPLNNNVVLAGRTPNDLLRLQNYNKAGADLTRARAMDAFMQASGVKTGGTTLDVARGMSAANNLRIVAANDNGKGFTLGSGDFIHTRNISRIAKNGRKQQKTAADANGLGKLSARFESGSDGIAAIGYDSTGGTSYGKYQIASKVGSMKSFLAFLDGEAPDLAKRLRSAGPANTGSRKGAMPNTWRAIAKEQPERFEQLQEAFIHQSHYKPALEAIAQKTGIDESSLSAAMREVIWSTAVQHGPAGAARIFARADDLSGKASDAGYERKMINNVYALRAGQFGSSTSQVRDAVRNRFRQERQLALKMLDGDSPEKANLA